MDRLDYIINAHFFEEEEQEEKKGKRGGGEEEQKKSRRDLQPSNGHGHTGTLTAQAAIEIQRK